MQSEPVQGTGDDAALSKFSCALQGYTDDKYIQYMVNRKMVRRSPLINRGYYARVAAVWNLIRDFMAPYGPSDGDDDAKQQRQPTQIISVGAGFDTTYFRLKEKGMQPTHYFEIDFPEQIKKKAALIKAHKLISPPTRDEDESKAKQSNNTTSTSPQFPDSTNEEFHLIPADLRDLKLVEKLLVDNKVDFSLPTLFLSECVLVYMPPKDSNAVIRWAASKFPTGVFITYEQIHPDDPFGKVMIRNLEMRGCSLLGLRHHPTLASQEERFRTAGWQHCTALDMNTVYNRYLPRDDVRRAEKIELFDEFEEWHLIQGHYCIVLAVNGDELKAKAMHRFLTTTI